MERERKRTHFKRTYEKVLLKFSGKENKEKQQDKAYEEQYQHRLRPNLA